MIQCFKILKVSEQSKTHAHIYMYLQTYNQHEARKIWWQLMAKIN